MSVLGVVLAGGESRRFGADKALATLAGRPLIAHVIDALRPQVDLVVVAGREHPGVRSVSDRPASRLGPLGGLNGALHLAMAEGFDEVMSIGCDVPGLPPDLVVRLRAAGPAAFVEAMPVAGLWPAALAPLLDAHIADDPRRSMRGWAARAGAVPVRLPAMLANINTRADLNRLEPPD